MKRWALVVMLMLIAARVGAYTIPYEGWMGTFMGGKKVGWMSLNVEKANFDGVDGYKISSVVNNRLTVLGADLTQLVNTVVYTDSNYAPLKESFSMSSGGKTTSVTAKFSKTSIEYEVSADSGSSSTKVIPIPEGPELIADPLFTTSDKFPKIGEEISLRYFNPLTLNLETLTIKVNKREQITLDGKSYDTLAFDNITPMGKMSVWQEVDGGIVQITGMMGITMRQMSREEALTADGTASAEDFAVLTSAKCNRRINNPREVKTLTAILEGIDDPKMLITDSRQTAKAIKDRPDATNFIVKAAQYDETKSQKLPINVAASIKEYTTPTAYVDSDAKTIIEQAKEVVGAEKNAYRACSKIRAWIYTNLRVQSDIGITRSGSDVLKSKVGVCRDYAILFAALARSSGIPCKVVSGLIYTDGAFYYHAWVECYTGQWVPFDATLSSDFVDATHIKLAEGDATTMFSLAKVIGSLNVEVVDIQ
ncbi:MAG: transglutaminase-like domain-containing protein [Armatimonadota bacterium]|jgi:hypothetical protein